MPLFGGRKSTEAAPATTAPATTSTTANGTGRSRSMFGRRRSSASSVSSVESDRHRRSGSTSGRKGFLGMGNRKSDPAVSKDPAVIGAHQKLAAAEEAEREADRALEASRRAVMAAREHCKMLETQAAEEARLAKAKRTEARGLGKQAKGLGRH